MSLITDLNLDPDTVTWESFASCKGLSDVDSELFYEVYENDVIMATNLDQVCVRCPVIKACHNAAVARKDWGLMGGFYKIDGKNDRVRNRHKSKEIKELLDSRLND